MSRLDPFWTEVEARLRSGASRYLDECGRLTETGSALRENTLYAFRNMHVAAARYTPATLAAFETRFNVMLEELASERVADAKAKVAGLAKHVEATRKAVEAYRTAASKLSAASELLKGSVATAKAKGAPSLIDHAVAAGPMAETLDQLDRVVRSLDYFDRVILAAQAREAEVLAWPEPTVENLDTLYAENVPHRAEAPSSRSDLLGAF
jgi:hypothetical protein